jgi:hypothetical protein
MHPSLRHQRGHLADHPPKPGRQVAGGKFLDRSSQSPRLTCSFASQMNSQGNSVRPRRPVGKGAHELDLHVQVPDLPCPFAESRKLVQDFLVFSARLGFGESNETFDPPRGGS